MPYDYRSRSQYPPPPDQGRDLNSPHGGWSREGDPSSSGSNSSAYRWPPHETAYLHSRPGDPPPIHGFLPPAPSRDPQHWSLQRSRPPSPPPLSHPSYLRNYSGPYVPPNVPPHSSIQPPFPFHPTQYQYDTRLPLEPPYPTLGPYRSPSTQFQTSQSHVRSSQPINHASADGSSRDHQSETLWEKTVRRKLVASLPELFDNVVGSPNLSDSLVASLEEIPELYDCTHEDFFTPQSEPVIDRGRIKEEVKRFGKKHFKSWAETLGVSDTDGRAELSFSLCGRPQRQIDQSLSYQIAQGITVWGRRRGKNWVLLTDQSQPILRASFKIGERPRVWVKYLDTRYKRRASPSVTRLPTLSRVPDAKWRQDTEDPDATDGSDEEERRGRTRTRDGDKPDRSPTGSVEFICFRGRSNVNTHQNNTYNKSTNRAEPHASSSQHVRQQITRDPYRVRIDKLRGHLSDSE